MIEVNPCKNCHAPKRLQRVDVFQTADPPPHAMTSFKITCLSCGYVNDKGESNGYS